MKEEKIENNIKDQDESNRFSGQFLRWTGSKRWFIKSELEKLLPQNFNSYHEPFLGSGSVFFKIIESDFNKSRKYHLSDINGELVNCYREIKNNASGLIRAMGKFNNSEVEYYKVRDFIPKTRVLQAARFLYLNRTSFNGIYRVNSKGEFNVPYGFRNNVDLITRELLLSVSQKLKGVSIKHQNFEKCITKIQKNDLVFIDPPYTVAHNNNGFIEYNKKLFSWDDQIRLLEFLKEIKKKRAYFIMTNACHKSILQLYSNMGKVKKLRRNTIVGGRNKTRGEFEEIVIYNTKQ